MGTSHTFSIHFWMDKSRKKENSAPIFVRITVNGKRATISLKVSNSVSKWDGKSGRLNGKNPEDTRLNEYLDNVESNLRTSYQQLISEGKHISSKAIKARYLGQDSRNKTLLVLVHYHNKHLKNSLAWGTLKNYFTTEKYIRRFLYERLKVEDIFLKELSYSFIIDFEYFLRNSTSINKAKPLSNNGIMKHLERLRKLMNLALELEWIDKHPFARFRLRFEKFERDYLSSIELHLFRTADLHDRLDLTRDIFVFACYTGLPYSDVKNLTERNLIFGMDGRQWITTSRAKNGKPVKLPLLDIPMQILHKYEEFKTLEKLLPVSTNQNLNREIKEIANVLKINKNLTFHSARHTFATTVTLGNGVPISTVSKMLGHSRITTTQVYAKVLDEKISRDMDVLSGKLGGSGVLNNTRFGNLPS